MSQPSVTSYFNTRKHQASDDLWGKSKVLLLERESLNQSRYQACDINKDPKQNVSDESEMVSPKIILRDAAKDFPCIKKVVRNIFDSPKADTEKSVKTLKPRVLRSRRLFSTDGCQVDIRESLQKMGATDVETRKVPFEKKGSLSPKKLMTPKKNFDDDAPQHDTIKEEEEKEKEPFIHGSETPTKMSKMERMATENLSLNDIRNKLKKSSRLSELKASIARFNDLDQQLKKVQKQDDLKKPPIQKFEKIELEIPVSPQKTARPPTKTLSTPIKNKDILEAASPQRRILFKPKNTTPSLVKCSPSKKSAYQKHLSVAESKILSLILPYNYRFLAEVFRCVETVSAMLFNRNELITFNKLKSAVQELLRRNFTQNHLAQIKTIYPDAYTYQQEKHRNFGSVSKNEKYELVLTPIIDASDGKNTPDEDNLLKSASNNMGPAILLERRRKFYNTLLERVKNEHEQFLLNLETPMVIEKEKIMRWHPEFDVEACKEIERAELPLPPQAEKASAQDILVKVKSLFNTGSRMEKALQRLAEANTTSKSTSSSTQDSTTEATESNILKVNIAIVDTPPTTQSVHQDTYLTKAFKGIPKALLEKVRARQAAKVLEEMTRTPSADKEAILYSRLPELAKILRNIYVAEKKGILPMETVIQRLDNSFKIKLTPNEMDEHIRLLCKVLPTWTSIRNVQKIDYLKLDRNVDITKVIKRLEVLANSKVK